MRHINHNGSDSFDVAILIKDIALKQAPLEEYYVSQLNSEKVLSMTLDYGGKKKPPAVVKKEYIDKLMPVLEQCGVKYIVCADSEYFKTLAKVQKADPHYGYVLPCAIKGYEHMQIVLAPNYQVFIYNDTYRDKLKLSLDKLNQYMQGDYSSIGSDIIHMYRQPNSLQEIEEFLNDLHQYPVLAADIEAFSLKHYNAGIGSIGFAWDTHNGGSFLIDYEPAVMPYTLDVWCKKDKKYKKKAAYGYNVRNNPVRTLLKKFFQEYKGTIIWHNAGYDITVLIYQLWMDDLLDYEGLLEGLEVMTRKFEDTKIITYLATNSCAGNKLSLKEQAHEFAGNYAESEIDNILLIEAEPLLKYNYIDCLSTWFVMDKHYDTMVLDEQYDLYYDLFIPCLVDIIQMQLTGMCLDMEKVLEAEKELTTIWKENFDALQANPVIQNFTHELRLEQIRKDNAKLKKKQRTYEEVEHITFNPNSGVQLQKLLYETLGLPVIDTTKSRAPATGGKTLKKLSKIVVDEEVIKILNHLMDYSGVNKVLTSFIPAFKEAPMAPDGMHYLFGSFNLGGTVSARLSSSNPNLQQIPSGSTYAKLIKACFVAPKGWLFCGSDFNALEDRINTLLTNDPAKEKVLLDGFDGHAYRAFYYFSSDMPDVKQLPTNTSEKCYKAYLGNTEFCFSSKDTIEYMGKIYTGDELYIEIISNTMDKE